jgi:hypothetical protein
MESDFVLMRIGEIRPPGSTSQRRVLQNPIKKNGDNSREVLTEEDMRLSDMANIEAPLKQTDWKIYGTGGAAELLGINPTTPPLPHQKNGNCKTCLKSRMK